MIITDPVILIPARYASQRLQGKLCMEIEGQPAICWTAQMAIQTGWDTIVLTDDWAIHDAIDGICPVILNSGIAPISGTERCSLLLDSVAEMLGRVPPHIIIASGDELTASPECIKSLYTPGHVAQRRAFPVEVRVNLH